MEQASQIEVRRSALKMWLLSLAGVPLLVLGIDVLRNRRIISFFQSLIWPNGNPEVLEPRDYIWAVALITVGLLIAIFGVAELVNPRPVLATSPDGLRLRIGSPFASLTLIPWNEVVDVGVEQLDDEGDPVSVFVLTVANPDRLPSHPWGARWLDEKSLAVLASDWETPPARVAEQVAAASVAASRSRYAITT
ncbi:MAG: hypothetical protein ACRDWA_12820 [Acidimicrobiia bacterium]